jgi:hypothetical protein
VWGGAAVWGDEGKLTAAKRTNRRAPRQLAIRMANSNHIRHRRTAPRPHQGCVAEEPRPPAIKRGGPNLSFHFVSDQNASHSKRTDPAILFEFKFETGGWVTAFGVIGPIPDESGKRSDLIRSVCEAGFQAPRELRH